MVTLLALAAAFCYALGAALQHAVAAGSTEQGTGFLAALFRRPAWLIGNVLNAAGWGLQAAALAKGELVYVQPLLLASVVLSLAFNAVVRRDWPGAREWIGSAVLVAGVVAFILGTRPEPSAAPAEGWLWTVVPLVVTALLCIVLGRRFAPATMWAIASGLLFGLAAALTKATVETGWEFLLHWPAYALAIVTPMGFYWMQRAYQSGPLAASFPAIIALDPIVSVLLGLQMGERVASDPASVSLAALGTAVTLAGIAVLGRSRFVDQMDDAKLDPSTEGGAPSARIDLNRDGEKG